MKELGIINRGIAKIISEQGHQDLLMVCDAGFAIPKNIEVIDISLKENSPMVIDTLVVLKKYFSIEKMILAKQTQETNPTFFKNLTETFDDNIEIEIMNHKELKVVSQNVKAVIRTGDFTAYANVILVSGAGERWYKEII